MQTLSLKVELLNPTDTNTKLANWLLHYKDLNSATSKVFSLFSKEKFLSVWCTFNNQNNKIEKEGNLYKVSFPTLEKRIAVSLVVREFQKKW